MAAKEVYHVDGSGSIVDEDGAVLYDADNLTGMTRKCRRKLARLHSDDPELDWERAAEILIAEGFSRREVWNE